AGHGTTIRAQRTRTGHHQRHERGLMGDATSTAPATAEAAPAAPEAPAAAATPATTLAPAVNRAPLPGPTSAAATAAVLGGEATRFVPPHYTIDPKDEERLDAWG